MTGDQFAAFALLAVTVGMFIWGRLSNDLVALIALLAGVALGIIPATRAFSGFGSDVVVIVATVLLVSAAIARSGAVETVMRPILRRMRTVQGQVPALVAAVTLLSTVTKNTGALATFIPIAQRTGRRTGASPAKLLMPMSFGSLLGGLVTLVGTSPNIIVAGLRASLFGTPFGMFDFAPVGLGIAVAGFVFLAFGYRLLPPDRRPASAGDTAFTLDAYTAEVRVPASSPLIGLDLVAARAQLDRVQLATIIRENYRRFAPTPATVIEADDVLLLTGEADDIERAVSRGELVLLGDTSQGDPLLHNVTEAVVTAESAVIGRTPRELELTRRHGLALLAVSRRGYPIERRLHSLRLESGDVLILKGTREQLATTLGDLRLLPLSERDVALGSRQRSWLPILILAGALSLIALHTLPVAVAFAGAAAAILLLRIMTMDEAYRTIEWSVIILLAALLPIGEAIRATGGTALIADALGGVAAALSPTVLLGVTMVVAMIATPFLNSAVTVLVLAPIAALLATRLHLSPDAFLMAVAVGAACDFLTPIGHPCNRLVMAPGGYRFGDYWRLGLPLSLIVILVGVPLIALVWGLG